MPYASRQIRQNNYLFELPLNPGQATTAYLRLQSQGSIQAPVALWSTEAYMEEQPTRLYVLGMIYGVLLVMLVYNLFIYLSVRDVSYLYYILYIASFGLYQVSVNGAGVAFLAGQPLVGQCRHAVVHWCSGAVRLPVRPAFPAIRRPQPWLRPAVAGIDGRWRAGHGAGSHHALRPGFAYGDAVGAAVHCKHLHRRALCLVAWSTGGALVHHRRTAFLRAGWSIP